MNTRFVLCAALLSGFSLGAYAAPDGDANALTDGSKKIYAMVKNNVLKSAEEMPEADYSYKPVASVRTFGQLVGHLADGQYEFCSALSPSKDKAPDIEKSKTSKADLIASLKESFSYCDKMYDAMTDAQAADKVDFFGRPMAKLSVLTFNIAHTDEHYGNLVTYLRMKGMVPPSSKK